jgi:hypothetical protein
MAANYVLITLVTAASSSAAVDLGREKPMIQPAAKRLKLLEL